MEVNKMNQFRSVNVWNGFGGASLETWAQERGYPLTMVDIDSLPHNEPLIVDIASMKELAGFMNPEQGDALIGYLKTTPLVLILSPGERYYPTASAAYKGVAAVVNEGNSDGLVEALCPIQLNPQVTDFIDLFGPPSGIVEEGVTTLAFTDFQRVPDWLRLEYENCGACRSRIDRQLEELNVKLMLAERLREQLTGAFGALFGAFGEGFPGNDSDEELDPEREVRIEAISDQLRRLANGEEPEPSDSLEVSEAFSRLPEVFKSHLATCDDHFGEIAEIIVNDGVASIQEDTFMRGPGGVEVVTLDASDPDGIIQQLRNSGAPPEIIQILAAVAAAASSERTDQPQG